MRLAALIFTSLLLANSLAQTQNGNDTETSSTTAASPVSSTSSSTTTTTTPPEASSSSSPPTPTSTDASANTSPSPKGPQWTASSVNSTCVLLRGNFTFSVTYTTPSGNTASDEVDIPDTAKTSGSCGPFLNSLVLTWDQGNLTFMFIKKPIYNAGVDTGDGSYSLTTIFGRITVRNPNDPQTNTSSTNSTPSPKNSGGSQDQQSQTFYITVREPGGSMTTTLNNSYSCESYQSIPADASGSVLLNMRNVQVEAFHTSPTSDFSPNQPCYRDSLSYVMSIVGYVALAVLIAAAAGYIAWKKFGRVGYTEV